MAANTVQLSGFPHATPPSLILDQASYSEEFARLKETAEAGALKDVVSWGTLMTPGQDLPIANEEGHSSPSETQAITTSTSVSVAPAPTSTSVLSKFMCHLATSQDLASKNFATVMDEMVGRMSDLSTAGWKLWDSKTTEPVPESTNSHASDRQAVENAQKVPSFARPHSKPGQDETISTAKAKVMVRVAQDVAFYQGIMADAHEREKESARRRLVKKVLNSFKARPSAPNDDKTSAAKSDIAKLQHHTFKCRGCHLGFQTPVQDAATTTSEKNEVQEGAQTGPRTTTSEGVASETLGHKLERKQTPVKVTSSGDTVHHLKCMFIGFASTLFVLAAYIGLSVEAPKVMQSRPSQEKIKLRRTVLDQQDELVRKDTMIRKLEMALRKEVSDKTAISELRAELQRKDTTIRNLEMALKNEVFNKTVSSRAAERKEETIVNLRKEAGELRAQLVQGRQKFEQLRAKIIQAQRDYTTIDEVFELREALRRKNIEMDELHNQLESTQAHVERLSIPEDFEAHTRELATKEQTISELTERLRGVTAAFNSVKGYCARVNAELESRTNTITSVTNAAKSLQNTLAAKDMEIMRNGETIGSLRQKLQIEADNNLQSRDMSYRILKENGELKNQIKHLSCRRASAQEDLRWAKARIGALEEENELNKGQWEKMDEDGEDAVDENAMQEVEDDENEDLELFRKIVQALSRDKSNIAEEQVEVVGDHGEDKAENDETISLADSAEEFGSEDEDAGYEREDEESSDDSGWEDL